jgi:hypothetical protein
MLPLVRGAGGSSPEDAPPPAFSCVWVTDAPLFTGKRVRLRSVRTDAWKLIVDHDRKKELLFHVAEDPRETRNLALEDPMKTRELLDRLDAWWGEAGAPGTAPRHEPSEELEERLRSLGYL